VLKVLVRYWKISCNLDNLSCFSWSDPFAVIGLIGVSGGSSRLKVAAKGEVKGEVGIGLDSNFERVSATATSLSSSSAALLARAREMYLRNAGPVDSSILSTFVFLFG